MRILTALGYLLICAALIVFARPFASAFRSINVTADELVLTVMFIIAFYAFFKSMFAVLLPAKEVHCPNAAMTAASPMGVATLKARSDIEREDEQKLALIARHEAGHAIAALALGHQLVSVSVRPQGISGGRTAWRHKDDKPISFDHLIVAFAGGLADASGDCGGDASAYGHRDDVSDMLRGAMALSTLPHETRSPTQLIDAAHRAAQNIVSDHQPQIDALAQQLIDTRRIRDLPGEDVVLSNSKE